MKRKKKIFLGIILALVVVTIVVLNLGRVVDFTKNLYSGEIQKTEDASTYEATSTRLEGYEVAEPASRESWGKSITVTLQKDEERYIYFYIWSQSTSEPNGAGDTRVPLTEDSITITKSSGTGKYYLHVHTAPYTEEIQDTYEYTYDGYLGPYYLDNTAPTPATMTMKLGDSSGKEYTDGTWTNQNVYIEIDASNAGDVQSGKTNLTHKYKVDKQNDDGSTTNLNTGLSDPVTLKDEGIYLITLETQDEAGNIASNTYTVKIDKTAPTAGTMIIEGLESEDNYAYERGTEIGWIEEPVKVWIDKEGSDSLSGIYMLDWNCKETGDRGDNRAYSDPITFENEGGYTIELTTRDNAGNTTITTHTLDIDMAEPTAGTVLIEGIVSGNDYVYERDTENIGWVVEPLLVYIDDVGSDSASGIEDAVYTVEKDGDIIYREDSDTSVELLEDGEYKITVTTTDNVGKTATRTYTVGIDRTAPTAGTLTIWGIDAALDYVPEFGTELGWCNQYMDVYINDVGSDEHSGVGNTDTKFVIYDKKGVEYGNESGIGSIAIEADGEYTIILTTTDNVGNTATRTYTVGIDKTAPELTIDTLDGYSDIWTNGNSYIGLKATDNSGLIGNLQWKYEQGAGQYEEWTNEHGSDLKYGWETAYNNGTYYDYAADGRTYAYATPGYNDEQNIKVYYRVYDAAGNISDTISGTIKIDKTVPTVDLIMNNVKSDGSTTTYTNDTWTNQSVKIALNCTEEAGYNGTLGNANSGIKSQTYTVEKDGTTLYANQTEAMTLTEEGTYTITVTAIDNARNTGTNTYTVKIDKTPLTAATMKFTNEDETEYTPGEDSWTNQTVNIILNDNASEGSTTTYKVEKGGSIYLENQTENTTLTEEGIYTITVTTTGSAGNTAINTYKVNIDKTAPVRATVTFMQENGTEYMATKSKTEANWTNQSITMNIHEDAEDTLSGIKEIRYEIIIDSKEMIKGNEREKILAENGIYHVFIKTFDNAGNMGHYADYVCIDKTAPIIVLGEDENTTWSETHKVTVNVSESPSGLVANQKIKYGWSTSATIAPTEYIEVDLVNSEGANGTTFEAEGKGLNGKYYLWVVPNTEIKDLAGNEQTEAVVSTGMFYFVSGEIEAATMTFTNEDGTEYTPGEDSWTNKTVNITINNNTSEGTTVRYTIDGAESSATSITGEGRHTIVITTTNIAGETKSNTYKVNIDKTAPTAETMTFTTEDGTTYIAPGSVGDRNWTNQNVNIKLNKDAKDELSGIKEIKWGIRLDQQREITENEVTLTENGTYFITLETYDMAGNKSHVLRFVNIDKTVPIIVLGENENTTWSETHSVGVTVSDVPSGLVASQKVKYGWSTSSTEAPTEYTEADLLNSEGANEATFAAEGTNLNGQYYLWVVPNAKITDLAGNEQTEAVVSTGTFNFESEIEGWDISKDGDRSVIATLSEDGTLTISGTGPMKDWETLTSPDWYTMREHIESIIIEKGVTHIGNNSFYDCKNLTEIRMSEGITTIGYHALYLCTNITQIIIPKSVTNIHNRAFFETYSLKEIQVDDENEYYCDIDGVLYSKDKTKIIKYPGGKENTLYNIVEGTTTVGVMAFRYCKNLTEITIPNTVTSIESNAFDYCSGLKEITIGDTVTDIGANVFFECENLIIYCNSGSAAEEYAIENDIKYLIIDQITFTNEDETEYTPLENNWTNQSVTIELKNSETGTYTVKKNDSIYNNLEKQTNPTTLSESGTYIIEVTTLNDAGEPKIIEYTVNIDQEKPIILIGELENQEGSELYTVTVTVSDAVTGLVASQKVKYGWSMSTTEEPTEYTDVDLLNSEGTNEVTFTAEATGLDGRYYLWVVPNTEIRDLAGNEMSEAKVSEEIFYFGEIIEEWDISVDGDRSVIATLSEAGTLTISGTGLMKDWGGSDTTDWHGMTDDVKIVIIEDGVTNIGSYAFVNCKRLTEIIISNTVEKIGKNAFLNCILLAKVEIPEKVDRILDYTFSGCTNLAEITIPNKLKIIGYNAFFECDSLKTITIPQSVISIYKNPFRWCDSLEEINVEAGNTKYCDVDGVLYNIEKTKIIKYPDNKVETTFNIIDGVTSIEEGAFETCNNLVEVVIPNTVTTIEERAFYMSTKLMKVEMPDSVTSIGSEAFAWCQELTDLTISEGLTTIKPRTFEFCSKLKEVIIPEGVTSIEEDAFGNCKNLIKVTIPRSVTNIHDKAIYTNSIGGWKIYCNSNTEAQVYAESKNKCVIDDAGPSVSIEENPTGWTTGNVTLTVMAEDKLAGMPKKAYSFDGGTTWQETNSKEYTDNTGEIIIKVKDNLGNIETITYTAKIDRTAPAIVLLENENTTLSQIHKVTVNVVENGSGLVANQKIKYGWSTSATEEPTEYKEVDLLNSEGANGTTFEAVGKYLTGEFYLWVVPNTELTDLAGNIQTEAVVSTGKFNFERGEIKAATMTFTTADGEYTPGEDNWTNKTVNITVNDYTSEGVTYTINGVESTETSIAEEGRYTIVITTSVAGETKTNTYKVNIDKTEPTAGTLIMKLEDENGEQYENSTLTNENVYIELTNGTDELSGQLSTIYKVEKDGRILYSDQTESMTLTEDGIYTITVTTTDNAGNLSTNTYTVKTHKAMTNKPILVNCNEGQIPDYVGYENGIYTFELAILNHEDFELGREYGIVSSEYVVLEKQGLHSISVAGGRIGNTTTVQVESGTKKTFIANVYWLNSENKIISSEYSNELVIDKTETKIEAATMTFTTEDGEYTPGENNWTNKTVNIIINNDVSEGTTVSYTIDGVESTATSITEEGKHIIEITTRDIAGNTATRTYKVNIDKTAPIIVLGSNENTEWSETHKVTVNVSESPSGLVANQKIKYGWSTSATIAPTEYIEVDLVNSEGANGTTFEAEGKGLNGKYYLWVVPNTEIKDLTGNEQREALVSTGMFYFVSGEIEVATMTFKNADGTEYTPGENSWTKQTVNITINNNTTQGTTVEYTIDGVESSATAITTEGRHTIVITTTNVAGETKSNTYKVNIDKTVPTTGTLIMKLENVNGEPYENSALTNKDVYIELVNGSDELSGHRTTTYEVDKDGQTLYTNQTEAMTLTEEGMYTIQVKTSDNAGNTSRNTYKVKIDKTGIEAATMTFATEKGEYTPGEDKWTNQTVNITLNNVTDGTTTYTIDGVESTATSITEEGRHTIVITTRDTAGNTATRTYKVNIDKTAPKPETITFKNNAGEIFEPGLNNWSNENLKLELNGDATDEMSGVSGIIYIVNANPEMTTITEEGTHSVEITTIDEAGNIEKETYTINIDKTVPTIVLGTNENTEWSETHKVTVNVTEARSGLVANQKVKYGWSTSSATAPTEYTEVDLLNSEGANGATFEAEGKGLNGKYYLWVVPDTEIKDLAGNVQREALVSTGMFYFVSGETEVATMTFTTEKGEYTPGENSWTNKTVNITINNNTSEGTTVRYTIDGVESSATSIAAEGRHTIVITTTNVAGETKSNTYKVNIDKTVPTAGTLTMKLENVNGEQYENSALTNKNVYIELVNGSDELSGHRTTTYEVDKDGQTLYTNQTESMTLTEEGIYTIEVTTTDNAENTSRNTYKVKIDKTLPTIVLGTNENTEWSETHKVTVNVSESTSGLVANQKVKYGWSTSATEEPTEYTEVDLLNSEGANGATFEAEGKGLNGKYYLWVVPDTEIKDLAGNEQREAVVSTGMFYFVSGEIEAATMTFTTEKGEYTPGENNWTNKTVNITINNNTSEGTTVRYTIDGVESSATSIAAEGRHTIVITTTNIAGETKSNTYKVNIDKTVPTIGTIGFTNEDGTEYAPGENSWTNQNVTAILEDITDELSGRATIMFTIDGVESSTTSITEEGVHTVTIIVTDNAGNIATRTHKVNIDKTVPTITKVEGNPENWTTESVTLTITATDSLSGLAENAYSFDNGTTWQAENTKTYTENTSGIVIKVKDAVGNVETYRTVDITKIDNEKPTIEKVTVSPTETTTETVTITIQATDRLSGLAANAYSFDNGETWQAENTKTYTENTNGIVIKVKDALGNISTHENVIDITNIIKERLEIDSEKYNITEVYISNVSAETTIENFLKNIKTNTKEVKITNKNNQEVTSGIIGTGMTVTFKYGDEIASYKIVVKGDINGDGKAKLSDLSKLKLSIIGATKLEGVYKEAADLNGDGKVKLSDLSKMKLYILGKVSL